jgi:hypothetical protein
MKGRDHFGDIGVNKRMILKMDAREIKWQRLDWIRLAQDTDQ